MRIIEERVRLAASDVANFLACRHLTRLDLLRARGVIRPPHEYDAGFEDLIKRGEAHEKGVLQGFRERGLQVVEISPGEGNGAGGADATAAALSSGVDVIYQGVLTRAATAEGEPALLGYPDFLVRADLIDAPDGEPRPDVNGGPGYEVVDAKLARSAKGRAVAQTAFYSALLGDLQGGAAPRWLHLALGTGELVSFKVADFAAYERQTRRLLTEFIEADSGHNPPSDTYPEPVEHCAICRWSDACAVRRRGDDDLSLVAGMAKGQRRRLKEAGVSTRRGFAALDPLPVLRGTSRESLERARSQAVLQVRSEDAGVIGYEMLAPDRDPEGELVRNRGLLALPAPVAGDLFFDIEGARYYSEDQREFGLQYLFGIVDTADVGADGAPAYRQFWAFDRAGEKRAFEGLIDFITARRGARPWLHVYHYNHYEPTSVDHLSELHETRQEAVGRLMGRFATREDEVDELFRLGVFVDLYRVLRQGLQAGVESYSIKRLEPLCGYSRGVPLRDATAALVSFEAALDCGSGADEVALREVVAGYNEDDCRATLALRDWLESLRPALASRLGLGLAELPRPEVAEPEGDHADSEVAQLRSALLSSVPAQPAERTPGQSARALLADLLEWHRRENKPAWWRYFYVRTLSSADLVDEPDALGLLSGGVVVGPEKKSLLWRLSFPPQEHKFGAGATGHDPITDRAFEVWDVDDARGEIVLKVGRDYDGPLPAALVQGGPPGTRLQAERMRDLGSRVLADGLSGLDAATALLLRSRPSVAGPSLPARTLPLRRADESAQDAAVRLALSLQTSYLPIQGPPGTGKTYTGAEQILALIAAGQTVGITALSHAVICNLIDAVFQRAAAGPAAVPRVGQKTDRDNPFRHPDAARLDYPKLVDGLANGDLDIAAGTTWMWSRPDLQNSVDTLFVDEAGQMSLADVIAVAGAARNLVLLGDPQQLAQPSQAAHPPGSGVSALEHILGERATMPPDAGLLIDKTWRMHPKLCRFTSETFYDGKLAGVDGLQLQEILGEPPLSGAGLRVVEVPHEGNSNSSPEEAAVVADLVRDFLGRPWRDRDGDLQPIGVEQIMIVTPYNAQIRAVQSAAASAGLPRLQVGTVDKFQGREAPVVIYSMATSSADDAPRGMEFLYDLHRLNVATSRAKALAIIVASPDLVRVCCQTPRQMLLANALCHAWDSRT